MGARAFYQHCREGGLEITRKETDYMRDAWIDTFYEMKEHMAVTPVPAGKVAADQFGYDDDDDVPREEDDGQCYIARCVNGFVRNRASRNAACNAQFQSLVAGGAKLAGYELMLAGYGDRLQNFVHDEYLYWLWPWEVREHIPVIESLMLKGIGKVIPDVKVSVESEVMRHWDKGAKVYTDLEWTEDGLPVVEDTDFVRREVLKQTEEEVK